MLISGSASRTSRLREVGLSISAALVVLAVCLLLVARDPTFFWHDDYQSGGPVLVEIARCLREGEWPLMTDHSWLAGCFAGDLQPGVLNLVQVLVAFIAFSLPVSMPAAAAINSLPFMAVLAAGTFRLARGYGLDVPLSMLAVGAACLNGMIVTWGASDWLPLMLGFAWLPWVWAGLRRAVVDEAPARWAILSGVGIYLLVTAGWPFNIVMVLAVSALVALEALLRRRTLWAIWPVVAAWVVGVGLSAPALLVFVEHIGASMRGKVPVTARDWTWVVPPDGLWGFILPSIPSIWRSALPRPHLPIELTNGVVPIAALIAGLVARTRRSFLRSHALELGLFVTVLAATMLPSLGNFRWSFRWLPLVHLTLAVLAGRVLLAAHQAADARWWERPSVWATGLVAWASLLSLPVHIVSNNLWMATLAVMAGWAIIDLSPQSNPQLVRWAPPFAVFASLLLVYWYVPTGGVQQPLWNFTEAMRQPAPLQLDHRYIAFATMNDYMSPIGADKPFGTTLRPANTPMWADLDFVNGYSTTAPRGMTSYLGLQLQLGPEDPRYIRYWLTNEVGPAGLLAYMAVDGVIIGNETRPDVHGVAPGWKLATVTDEGTVWTHKGPPPPRVRTIPWAHLDADETAVIQKVLDRHVGTPPFELAATDGERVGDTRKFGPATLGPLVHGRRTDSVTVTVGPQAPALVLFSRAWYPGFRAWLDGRELPVRVLADIMPAVEVPAGSHGTLVLSYWPRVLTWGLTIAGLTLFGFIPALLWLGRRRAV